MVLQRDNNSYNFIFKGEAQIKIESEYLTYNTKQNNFDSGGEASQITAFIMHNSMILLTRIESGMIHRKVKIPVSGRCLPREYVNTGKRDCLFAVSVSGLLNFKGE